MSTVNEIIDALTLYSSNERTAKSVTVYPTRMHVMGVTNPDLKKVLNEVYKALRPEYDSSAFISLAKNLVAANIIECQMFAYLLLEKANVLDQLQKEDLDALEGVLDNWVSVDTYGVIIYGTMWRLGVINDSDVLQLQEEGDLWHRRLALVATVALNLKSRGGRGDTVRTLMVCEGAVNDPEDMIVKALSWALRSLVRWDHAAVKAFMDQYQEMLPRRVNREVHHKLEHGTKN